VPIGDGLKRLIVGRAIRSDRPTRSRWSKRVAIPAFASDALSSNAYATQEILLVLALGGVSLLAYGPWVGLAVIAVFVIVVASYRQNIRAYPDGAGDYHVVSQNLGRGPGLVVASALLIDYVLTVAVSISAAAANLVSLVPALTGSETWIAVGGIAILGLLNIRGLQQHGRIFSLPTYLFLASVGAMIVVGLVRSLAGQDMRAVSADWLIEPEAGFVGAALIFLIARSFASGTTALTGIGTIANGVPQFTEPRAKNAMRALVLVGVASMALFAGITWLALATGVKVANNDADLIGLPEGQSQQTVLVQVADAVLGGIFPLVLIVGLATVLILLLAANTAFNGFPALGSILGRDGYLPRQLHNRGDRLVYTNGILMLTLAAIALVVAFGANVTSLIQLYIVGVFVAFGLSQLSMVRHWSRAAQERMPRAGRARIINLLGLLATTSVLAIVLISKFTRGGWLVVVAIPILALVMLGISRHYDRVARELAGAEKEGMILPTRVHALVLVSRIHKPTLRAVAYARATRPTELEAVTVQVDIEETEALQREWNRRGIPVALRTLESPYREVTRPIVEYVESLRSSNPNDVVIVYIPEYVVGGIWQRMLHNRSVARIRAALLEMPGVMLTSVPWQLRSSDSARDS
jgi:amino acid transporter